MTIDVSTPDGSSFSFPDGTPQDTIHAALQSHFGAPKAAPAAAAPPAFDVNDPRFKGPAMMGGEMLKGVPVLGGYVDKASAALSALAHPVTGVGAEGGSLADRYAKNLEQVTAASKQFEAEHPVLSTGAELAGGVVSTLPVASTALGARLLGLTGTTLPRQVGMGMLSSGALGGADAAVRGGDVEQGAGISALAGMTGPVVGRAIGGAVQGARNLVRGGAATAPQNVMRVGGVDVPLSGGQATGDVATQMMENTALRGGEGQAPQRVAEQFFRGTQDPAVERARANIGQGLDRFGQNVVDNPQAAGDLVSESVRGAERAGRQNYQGLYDQVASLPGEIHAAAFEGIGQRIKGALSLHRDPVIIDDVTTPVASKAIQDVDNTISRLNIQNRADPFGQPNPQNIVGVNLAGVDQARKRLVSMASAAQPGTADRRAVGRIISEFDNQVEDAISGGMFSGDDRALDALREARRAYSEHRQTFRSQGAGDDVGRAMERIVGRNGGQGATANEVANYLFGEARVGSSGTSVRLAQRLQNVLGPDSPEWSGIRQGLWSRLTEATEGRTDFGPQKASERIYEFLNGSGQAMSHILYSPAERAQMAQYAGLLRQLVPRPGTVNYSNTAPVLRMLAGNALKGVTVALGADLAGPVGALAGYGANSVGRALTERSAAGRVARSLYRSPAQNAVDQDALRRSGVMGGLAARLATMPYADQRQ